MDLQDLTVLSSLNRSLAGQQKTAGFWDASEKVSGVLKSLLNAGKSTAKMTAEKPLLAGTALATGAGATHVGKSGTERFLQELQMSGRKFDHPTIRGGLF